MALRSSLSTCALLPLLLLVLPAPSGAYLSKSVLSCKGHCFLSSPERQLRCGPDPPPPSSLTLECTAARVRGGIRVTIGGHEAASRIHPTGLLHFNGLFANLNLTLILQVKFKDLSPQPLMGLPLLRHLKLVQQPKNSLDPCFFVDPAFSGRLESVQLQCMGSGLDLHAPFHLVWPRLPRPPTLELRFCGVSPQCYDCQGAYRSVIVFEAKRSFRLEHRQKQRLSHCHEDKKCPRQLLRQCPSLRPSTPADVNATEGGRTTEMAARATLEPAVAAAIANQSQRVGYSDARRTRNPSLLDERRAGERKMKEEVEKLKVRSQRTQRLLIIIVVVSVVNSLVLIGLLVYVFRTSRGCCGNGSKGVYVVAKNTEG